MPGCMYGQHVPAKFYAKFIDLFIDFGGGKMLKY